MRVSSAPRWDIGRKLALTTARIEAFLSTRAFEIFFLFLFICANILVFVWGAHGEFDYNRHEPFVWYIAIARGAGYILNLNCPIILILASRVLITFIRDTPFHKVLPLDKCFPAAHIVVGYFILGSVLVHALFHMLWIFPFKKLDEFKLWSFSMTLATGFPLFSIFISMFVTAIPWIRRKFFRIFYVIHMIAATLFFSLLIIHGMYRKVPETYKWIIPALIVYIIDRLIRIFTTSRVKLQLSGAHSTIKTGNILELRVPKSFEYRAGQYAEIQVPSISREWHPFTIASAPHEDTMCFYVKANGNWTGLLYQEFVDRISDITLDPLDLSIRGPFGAPAQGFNAYKRVVMISGGIGATPFAAVCKHLQRRSLDESLHASHTTHRKQNLAEDWFEDSVVFRRMSLSICQEYQLPFDLSCIHQALKQLKAKKNRAGRDEEQGTHNSSETTQSEYSSDDTPLYHSVRDLAGDTYLSRFPGIHRLRNRVLSVLHSTQVTMLLLLSIVVRFSLFSLVAIRRHGDIHYFMKARPQLLWVRAFDGILSILLTVTMAVILALEISYMGRDFFANFGRNADFFVFLPMSILSTILCIRSWVTMGSVSNVLNVGHFALILPLLLIQLAYRMYRSVGSRSLLNCAVEGCGCKCKAGVPEVDFVWTTPNCTDDKWLRDELAPFASRSVLRLHRYITRGQVGGSGIENDIECGIELHTGRPDWNAFLAMIADTTRSGADIGIFFCGPPAMGKAVRRAMREVEVRAHLRGVYLSRLSDAEVEKEFQVRCPNDVRRLRSYGCNVRLVFKEENF